MLTVLITAAIIWLSLVLGMMALATAAGHENPSPQTRPTDWFDRPVRGGMA